MSSQKLQSLIQFYNNQNESSTYNFKSSTEECYQVDSNQWLNLGQPNSSINKLKLDNQKQAIPPRKTRNSSIDVKVKLEINKSSIDLNQFRKSIQSLWFTLLNQNNSTNHNYYDDFGFKILLPGSIIRLIWLRSGLPLIVLSKIWDSIDKEKKGCLNFEEFLLGMYQISKLRQEMNILKQDKLFLERINTPPLIPSSGGSESTSSCDSISSEFD